MYQFEAVGQPTRLQRFAGDNEVNGVQAELGVFTAAGSPFPGAFAGEANANTNERLNSNFFRNSDCLFKLFKLFDNDNDGLAQLAPKQGYSNERSVLVTVADNQAIGILVHRQGSDQFGFAAGLQSEVVRLTSVNDLFDDFAQLVNFNR